MKKILKYIMAVPKTMYINIKCFGWKQGIKMPIFCAHRVKISGLSRGAILIDNDFKAGMIRLGMSEGSFEKGMGINSSIRLAKGAKLIFKGKANLCNSFSINLNDKAEVCLGDNFYSNFNFLLSCSSRIHFGEDSLIGWNVQVLDGDGHNIGKLGGKIKEISKPIKIGNHVWICAGCTILKGTVIKDGSIVALNSVCSSRIEEEHVLIAGIPAKVIKSNIEWQY